MRKLASLGVAALFALVLVGCGGSGSTTLGARNPRVRVMDSLDNPTNVKIAVNHQVLANNSQYGFATGYTVIDNGNQTVQFSNADTGASLVDTTELFELDNYYTVIGYNTAGGPREITLSDIPNTGIASGHAMVRVVNVATQNVDVYITAPGANLNTSTPTVTNDNIGDAAQAYTDETIGTYEVRVTQAGTKNVLASNTFAFQDRLAQTIVFGVNNGTYTLSLLAARPI
ncbi:DUF4397 domain-containing protein [Fimbriimonas ginsengisoli]|uniref:DUF4397 domain-containing protein n=1 Tax=Fimbriimonas ginsengisoli TaxID=1005039 RepID=UPI00046CDCD3|nr:DUF4397 domain-containing protein [Fimbriimonas ginsengisoli]